MSQEIHTPVRASKGVGHVRIKEIAQRREHEANTKPE